MKTKLFLVALLLLFWMSSAVAATRYASTSGSGSACTVLATPCTLATAVGQLVKGDTLYLRAGSYNNNANTLALPTGTAWTAGNFTTIANYNNEAVTIQGWPFITFNGSAAYVLFQGTASSLLKIDGMNSTTITGGYCFIPVGGGSQCVANGPGLGGPNVGYSGDGSTKQIRMDYVEITRWTGIAVQLIGDGAQLTNSKVHDNGTVSNDNCVYATNGSTNALIEHNEIHHCTGAGVQIYSGAGPAIVRYNNIHHTSTSQRQLGLGNVENSTPETRVDGIVAATGFDNSDIYGNVIHDITDNPFGTDQGGIAMVLHVTGVKVYNNTIYNVRGQAALMNGDSDSCNVFRNNLVYQPAGNSVPATYDGSKGCATAVFHSSNMTSNVNPQFVNVSTGDFSLQSTSSAINSVGISLGAPYNVDYAGVSRPQPVGGIWDVGAYEYVAPAPTVVAYWVDAVNGQDVSGCTKTSTPQTTGAKRTINYLFSNCTIGNGDTIYLRAGTYVENIDSAAGNLPTNAGASSYAQAITIQSYPPDGARSARIKPSSGQVIRFNSPGAGINRRYFIFKDLILDGSNDMSQLFVVGVGGGGNGGQTGNIKFDNVEILGRAPGASTTPFNCVGLGGDDLTGDSNWVTNNSYIHQCGISAFNPAVGIGHAFYVESHDNIIENSEIADTYGFGIHNYAGDPSNNIYRNLKIHDVCLNLGRGCAAFLLQTGTNSTGYNLLIYRSAQQAISIAGGPGFKVFNSTVYNNNINCASSANGCQPVVELGGSTSATMRNVVLVGNTSNSIGLAGASAFALSNNVTSGDPTTMFVNPAGGDFHLLSTATTLIDQGTDVSAVIGCSPCTDYAGVTRAGAWDIGAYEYTTTSGPITGLILALGLDEGTGLPQDKSGYANHVTTLQTGVTWQTTGCKYGNACLSFSGSGGALINDSPSFSAISTGFTLEAWVKPASTISGFFSHLLGRISSNEDGYVFLFAGSETGYCSSGGPMAGFNPSSGTTAFVCQGSLISPTVWSFYAATYDSSVATNNLKLYLNGAVVAQTTVSGNVQAATASALFYIGTSFYNENFTGQMDNIRVYANQALTQAQIQTDMNAAIGALTVQITQPTTNPTYSTSSATLTIGGTSSLP